jgi:DNA-binding LacI/PurR family transcriptional regulator
MRSPVEHLVEKFGDTFQDNLDDFCQFLDGNRRIDCILIENSYLSGLVFQGCLKMGIKVSSDMEITSFGWLDMMHIFFPLISELRTDNIEVGEAAVMQLEKMIKGKNARPQVFKYHFKESLIGSQPRT